MGLEEEAVKVQDGGFQGCVYLGPTKITSRLGLVRVLPGNHPGGRKNSPGTLMLSCLFPFLSGIGKTIGKMWDESELNPYSVVLR